MANFDSTRLSKQENAPGSVLVGNFDFRIAAGRCRLYRSSDTVKVTPDLWPLLVAEDNDRNSSPGKILLVAYVLVRGQEHLVTGFFSLLQQLPILQFVPAGLARKSYVMTSEAAGDGLRRAVIK